MCFFQTFLVFLPRCKVLYTSVFSLKIIIVEPLMKSYIEIFPRSKCVYLEELFFEYSPPSLHFSVSLRSPHSCILVLDIELYYPFFE